MSGLKPGWVNPYIQVSGPWLLFLVMLCWSLGSSLKILGLEYPLDLLLLKLLASLL